jgi:two-component system, LytTR family, response regulator
MKIRALIVDDEPLARERLQGFLARETDIYVVGESPDGDDAVQKILTLKPDLVFLDIQMPRRDGFGVLQALAGGKLPVIIFTTAFDEHALRAFDAHALDYLLKPFKISRFQEALQKAREALGGRGTQEALTRMLKLMEEQRTDNTPRLTRLAIKDDDRTLFIPVADIDWIEASGNYAIVHVGKQRHTLRETMAWLDTQLPEQTFLRVSRSAIVNLARVREVQPGVGGENVLVLQDGSTLEISRGIREIEQWLKYH